MGADDMEDLVAFVEQPNTVLLDREVPNLKTSIRALLKAYQEQRRALEAASPVVPAPEGEAWDHAFRPKATVECPWSLASSYPPDYAKFVLSDSRYEVVALYASPVVSAEVRRRVLDELDKAWVHGQRRTSWRRDESADAILAALRPTDTGANHD